MFTEERKRRISGSCDSLIMGSVLFLAFAVPFELTFEVPRLICEYTALLALIVKAAVEKRFSWPPLFLALPLSLYILFSIVTVATSGDTGLSLKVFRNDFLPYLILFFCVISLFNTKKRIKALVGVIVCTALITALIGIVSCHVYSLMPEMRASLIGAGFICPEPDGSFRPLMPYTYHNRLATYLMIASTYFFLFMAMVETKKWKAIFGVLTVLPVYCLFLTLTRAAWLGFFSAFLVVITYFALKSRKTFALSIVSLFIIFVLAFLSGPVRGRVVSLFFKANYVSSTSTIKLRLVGFEGAYRMIQEKPLLGFGFGWRVFHKYYPEYRLPEEVENKKHAHNNFIEIAVESGLITLFFYIGFLAAVFYLILKFILLCKHSPARQEIMVDLLAVMVAIQVNALANFSLRETNGMLVWVSTALAVSFFRMVEREQKESRGRRL